MAGIENNRPISWQTMLAHGFLFRQVNVLADTGLLARRRLQTWC